MASGASNGETPVWRAPASSPAPAAASASADVLRQPKLGPFAADCANSALREEVKKVYVAIDKMEAPSEGEPC